MQVVSAGVRKRSVGRSELIRRVSWFTPARTVGSSEKSASASNTSARSSFIWIVLGSTWVPASNASARIGAPCGSTATPGRSSRKKAVLLRMNGRWRGNSSIATCSLGGLSEIVSWRKGRAIDAKAVNDVSRFTNSDACSSATGATSADARASEAKKRLSRVSGSERLRATGSRSVTSGTNASIAVLRSGPRPAKPPPKPSSELREPTRVLSSNMSKSSSSSTTAGRAWRTGIVEPAGRPARPSPGVSSMYLRPSEERGRTSRVESAGTGSISLSSFIVTCAYAVPSALLLRLDLRDEAHAGAADAHLEALHELCCIRQVRLEVVGRHERKPGVRVV